MAWNTEKAPSSYEEPRYERKFVVSELTKHELELIVKLHPAAFSEIYHQRSINNLYFDSPTLENYYANLNGLPDRVKVRVRWYGELRGAVEEPVLELKIKKGIVGRKERFPLLPFTLDESFKLNTMHDAFSQSNIPSGLKMKLLSLGASLLNRYERKYFQSADGKFRLTIDAGMEFYRMDMYGGRLLHRAVTGSPTVIELKYRVEDDEHARNVTTRFPFRVTKSSKYANGLENLWLW